jgi:hypothetical protein
MRYVIDVDDHEKEDGRIVRWGAAIKVAPDVALLGLETEDDLIAEITDTEPVDRVYAPTWGGAEELALQVIRDELKGTFVSHQELCAALPEEA